jgi:hypothetical protein
MHRAIIQRIPLSSFPEHSVYNRPALTRSRIPSPVRIRASSIMATPAEKKDVIRKSIREIPDWPKPGVSFKDITTLLLDPRAFQYTIDLFVDRYRGQNVTAVVGTLLFFDWGEIEKKDSLYV